VVDPGTQKNSAPRRTSSERYTTSATRTDPSPRISALGSEEIVSAREMTWGDVDANTPPGRAGER
jgi:hypothetical protein